jgi:hypothetical protein
MAEIITTTLISGNLVYNDNKLYVIGQNGNCNVYNIDIVTGNPTTPITPIVFFSSPGGVSGNAHGMTRLYNGNFYVPRHSISGILKYNSSGTYQNALTDISNPIANAIANDIIYVSSYPSNIVKTINISTSATNSSFLEAIGTIINSLAISGTTLYVATDNGSGTIYWYNIINRLLTVPNVSITGVGTVYGMVLDNKYLYTTNTIGNVKIYNKDTGGAALYSTTISGATGLRGIALGNGNSYIYVSTEVENGKVYKIANPYSYIPCFLEGSKILQFNPETQTEQYVPIETLRPGDLIKTSRSGYKAISHIGKKDLPDPATNPDKRDRLYVFDSKWADNTSENFGPLCLTGRHCLLHTKLSESEIEKVKQFTGDIFITENKYRVPAYLDARRKPYTKTDPVVIWHFALENDNIYKNYGVMANGLLVESSSIEYMTDHSNMELL